MKAARDFFIAGSIVLTLSNVSVRLLSYAYRIVMARLLSPYQFGILNLALPAQFMVIMLTSSGIAPSIAKFVSDTNAKRGDLNRLASSVIFYYTLGGAAIGLVFFFLAWPLGIYIFKDVNAVVPLQISALAVPFTILVSTYTGIFQGLKKVGYMSGALLFEQGMRIVLSVVLVIAGFEALGAIGCSSIGFAAAVPMSFILFKRMGLGLGERDIRVFKEVFYFSIPTSVTAISS